MPHILSSKPAMHRVSSRPWLTRQTTGVRHPIRAQTTHSGDGSSLQHQFGDRLSEKGVGIPHLILYLDNVSRICGAWTVSSALEVNPNTLCPWTLSARTTLETRGGRREGKTEKEGITLTYVHLVETLCNIGKSRGMAEWKKVLLPSPSGGRVQCALFVPC